VDVWEKVKQKAEVPSAQRYFMAALLTSEGAWVIAERSHADPSIEAD
jgi:hypothetical protein